jgi:transcriptional regulator
MHPNPIFRETTEEDRLAFARTRSFGLLAVADCEGAPLLAHVPFLLSEDGREARLHLVRSNTITRALRDAPRPARIAVSGPDGYISPDWYGVADQVPTWNYVAVHLTGRLELLPEAELRALLDAQSAHFEAMLAPKAPWTSAKMSGGVMERMMRQIVPARLIVEATDGTWKLGQNKTDDARRGAADGLEGSGIGSDVLALAALMRDNNAE